MHQAWAAVELGTGAQFAPVFDGGAVHAPPGQQAAQQAAEVGHRLARLGAGDGNGLVVQQRAAVAAVGDLWVVGVKDGWPGVRFPPGYRKPAAALPR